MSKSIIMANVATVDLEPEVIPPDWILSGTPRARCQKVARSHDLTSHVVVWDCTAGKFKWHFNMDETIIVVSGEAFLINEKGEERRFGPGDLGFFPAGTSCTWRIADHFKKIGVLREPMWRPLGLGLKVWHRLLQIAGITARSPLTLALAALSVYRSTPPTV